MAFQNQFSKQSTIDRLSTINGFDQGIADAVARRGADSALRYEYVYANHKSPPIAA